MEEEEKNLFLWKVLALIFSWLTFSPLFFYWAKRWKLVSKRWRIILLLLSPMALLCYALIGIFIFLGYLEYERKYGFLDKDRIERITEVRLPDFKLIEYDKGRTGFNGDYSDYLTIEFKDSLTNDFFVTLDSLVEKEVWSKRDNRYSFSAMWGNGLPAPKGENKEEDVMFSITIERGTNTAVIDTGTW